MKSWTRWLVLLALGVFLPLTAASATYWEIEPKEDPRIALGKIAVVQGAVTAEGVLFVVNNITLSTPVQVTLVSEDGQPVELSVFKDSPEQPLLLGTATPQRSVTFRFRTDQQAHFAVRGTPGSRYQMLTWVGPETHVAAPATFTPMAEFLAAQAGTARPQAATVPAPVTPNPIAPASSSKWIPILLALIFVSLVIIIVLLSRGCRSAAGAAALLFAFGAHTAAAEEGIPKRVEAGKEGAETGKVLDELREKLEQIKKNLDKASGTESTLKELSKPFLKKEENTTTAFAPTNRYDKWTGEPMGGPVTFRVSKEGGEEKEEKKNKEFKMAAEAVEATKLAMAFLEEFGLIDPREAAVRPNLNPPGKPPLPSRCAGSRECKACFSQASGKLEKARQLLETQYVIYKQTELQVGRIMELADAAAGLSPYAKLAWETIKTNPSSSQNVAQAKFYATYDGNLIQLLKMMNDALIAVGDCEREQYGDQDWFNRYGMPYYLFMRERYTRK